MSNHASVVVASPKRLSQKKVLISVLNWNTAEATLACVDGLLRHDAGPRVCAEILVIDNGSAPKDVAQLKEGMQAREQNLRHEAVNLGFAGGHNLAIDYAIEHRFDYIWLVNSDALIREPNVLASLIACIESDPQCGAVSPLLAQLGQPDKLYFRGNFHDWAQRESLRPSSIEEGKQLAERMPDRLWISGAAILLRVAALEQIGGLDERYFAYYEDDDICVRLVDAGWRCRVDFESRVEHEMPLRETDRSSFYFYLRERNYLQFWYRHTPNEFRRLLLLKLLDQAFFDVNRLYRMGHTRHAECAMLGIYDFLCARWGVPRLERRIPLYVRLLRRLLWIPHMRVLQREPAHSTSPQS